MTEVSAIWMFLSIAAICFTWHKIATLPERKAPEPTPLRELNMLLNGKPFNGSLHITAEGETRTYRVIDGKLA